MFRIRFQIFSVPYRAEMSIRNPTPPGTQPHTITLNPKPSARNLSNPSFSSNLSNLCHCATSYPDPPSKLGSSIFSNETSTNKRIEVGLWSVLWRGRGSGMSYSGCQNVCIIDWLYFCKPHILPNYSSKLHILIVFRSYLNCIVESFLIINPVCRLHSVSQPPNNWV